MLTLLMNSLAVLRLKQNERVKRRKHSKVRGLPPMSDHLLRDIGMYDLGTVEEQDWEARAFTRTQAPKQSFEKSITEPAAATQDRAPEPPFQTRST